MYLLVCATKQEMEPIPSSLKTKGMAEFLVAGVGPTETALRLTKFLAQTPKTYSGIINFGIAGAYFSGGAQVLDICLAKQEVFGDFGVTSGDDILPFEKDRIDQEILCQMDNELLERSFDILEMHNLEALCGNFVTVNTVTGTRDRGQSLQKRFDALCENMEGAAVARVCAEFNLPCLEIRCVSNLVDERDIANWKLIEAMQKAADYAALLTRALSSRS